MHTIYLRVFLFIAFFHPIWIQPQYKLQIENPINIFDQWIHFVPRAWFRTKIPHDLVIHEANCRNISPNTGIAQTASGNATHIFHTSFLGCFVCWCTFDLTRPDDNHPKNLQSLRRNAAWTAWSSSEFALSLSACVLHTRHHEGRKWNFASHTETGCVCLRGPWHCAWLHLAERETGWFGGGERCCQTTRRKKLLVVAAHMACWHLGKWAKKALHCTGV